MKLALYRVFQQFLKCTTLHGFKYLASPYYLDRFGWLACCCASACCSAVLCCVLWARFQQVPALLMARDSRVYPLDQPMPMVAVCTSQERLVHLMVKNMTLEKSSTQWLPILLNNILRGRPPAQAQLQHLEVLLRSLNLTLPEMLLRYTPPCTALTTRCRWQDSEVPCDGLFKKELSQWGACCIMHPDLLQGSLAPRKEMGFNLKLELVLNCFNGTGLFACEFFTRFRGEEWVSPTTLSLGTHYFAKLKFHSVMDPNNEDMVTSTCVSSTQYSKRRCLRQCAERVCGCSDPLRDAAPEDELPPCPVGNLACLLRPETTATCACLPSCKEITPILSVESSLLTDYKYTFDPLYKDLDEAAIVLQLRVKITGSKIFERIATETWITLLSSLGGVFNMFLGVGLFSALEFLFLVVVRLPVAIKKSSEIGSSVVVVHQKSERAW